MLLRPLRQLAVNTTCKSLIIRKPSLLRSVRIHSCSLIPNMADTVDLTFSSDEEHEDQEQAHRKRIMAFAQQQNKRARVTEAPAPQTAPADPAPQNTLEPDVKEEAAGPSTSSQNNLLAQLHEERRQRQQASGTAAGPSSSNGDAGAKAGPSSGRPTSIQPPRSPSRGQGQAPAAGSRQEVSVLSYNVWFREDVALQERMDAIGRIIEDSGYPTFLCFQEVTPLILSLWRSAPWWRHYTAPAAPSDRAYFTLLLAHKVKSPAPAMAFRDKEFPNSVMGRSLMTVDVPFGGGAERLVVGTSHLESPIPQQQNFYSAERKKQLAAAIRALDDTAAPNVLFVGDMNWTDSRDGAPSLTPGWQDVWQQLRPREDGLTYDTKGNAMLFGSWAGSRLDRCFVKLTGYRAASIQMVGTEALPGVTYEHIFRNGSKRKMHVLPSDHYGLLIKLQPV